MYLKGCDKIKDFHDEKVGFNSTKYLGLSYFLYVSVCNLFTCLPVWFLPPLRAAQRPKLNK